MVLFGRFIAGGLLVGSLAVSLFAAEQQAEKKPFFLPKNPVAAAYVLGRLSNQELIEAPRSEFVYVALLTRAGLDRKYRLEALEGLAKERKTDTTTELLRAITDLDKKGEDALPALHDLGPLLAQAPPDSLKKEALSSLAADAQLPFTKQIALAGLISAGEGEKLWKESEFNPEQLANLIEAIPLVKNAQLRAAFYPKLKPLLNDATPAEVRRAAISSLSAIPGHEPETFQSLAGLLEKGSERAVAIASLQKVPRKTWPKEAIEPMANRLIADLQKTPPAQRSEQDFLNAIQFASELASLLPKEKAAVMNKTLREIGVAVFVIHTIPEQMLYDKSLIVVEAGKPVEIILMNEDAMPHNIVITAPNSIEEIGTIAEKMPLEPDAQGRTYIPNSPKVLAGTKMVDPGQKTRLSFTAPSEPGDYGYVCTFPGHWRRMFGKLAVVKDVDAYLASNAAQAEPEMTEWKMENLTPELTKLKEGRNAAAGKQLFTNLGCAQCHKIAGEGLNYGPDLTDIFKKYNNDASEVLRQMIEPSAKIDDKYRVFEFETKDGESTFGIIAKEDPDNVTVQTGPAESQTLVLKKSQIKQRTPQNSSPMPMGLLNTISKDHILDLLAFLQAGGKVPAHEHNH